jgi:hypothetical protein
MEKDYLIYLMRGGCAPEEKEKRRAEVLFYVILIPP